TVTVAGIDPVVFNLKNTVGTPFKLEPVSGDKQVAMINTAFAQRLVVLVLDKCDNLLSSDQLNGKQLSFVIKDTGGASGYFDKDPNKKTDNMTIQGGVATSLEVFANDTASGNPYKVIASINDIETSFWLTNEYIGGNRHAFKTSDNKSNLKINVSEKI